MSNRVLSSRQNALVLGFRNVTDTNNLDVVYTYEHLHFRNITSSLSSSTPSLAHDSATTSSTTSAPSIITATVFTYPAEQTSTSTRAPLSTGAAAGIAIAATILLITALLMAFLFWARQRLHLGLTKPEPSSHRGRHTVDSIISDRHGSSSSSPVLPPCAMRTSPYTVRQASRGGSYKPDLDSSEDAPLQPWLLSDRIEPSCPPLAHTYSKHGHSPTPSSSCSSSSNQAPREKLPESYYSGIPPISVSVVERLLHSLAQHMDHQEPPTQLQVAAAAEGHRASEFDLVAIDEPPPQYPYGRS
ncbi:hypothetical protein BC835DRAFT_324170 [Cytidiella melzeri]|nr:hypothetical protein BC835DRAFT_324170 [Cytidiella melzeri]